MGSEVTNMESIWSVNGMKAGRPGKDLPEYAENVVIGAGMAGILCAFLLREAGCPVTVLEANTIYSGQTKNTTAKITSQHGLIYSSLKDNFGEETACAYGRAEQKAIDEYERIIKEKNVECGFRRLPSFLYTGTDEGFGRLELERTAAKKAGIPATIVYETDLPFPIRAALKFERQAQFDPVRFLNALVPELTIFEHTPVLRIRKQEVITDRGTVRAGNIVVATHFPFLNFPGFYFARMHQERSYVLAVETHDTNGPWKPEGMYYGIDRDGLSFRGTESLVLIGGKGHRTGVIPQEDPHQALRTEAGRLWPRFEEKAFWSAQDCMTLDQLPYIGIYGKRRPNLYVATGFGKWGMTNSMAAAAAIRDQIMGRREPDWNVFSPQRRMNRTAFLSLAGQTAVTVRNFVTVNGPRCPHLGCRLKWNPYEQTWDCPCHGSRFRKDGTVLDNPAQCGIKDKPGEVSD